MKTFKVNYTTLTNYPNDKGRLKSCTRTIKAIDRYHVAEILKATTVYEIIQSIDYPEEINENL